MSLGYLEVARFCCVRMLRAGTASRETRT